MDTNDLTPIICHRSEFYAHLIGYLTMGKRLSKIYTRTGDQGTTGLGDGSRVEKHHPRIELIGTIDEINSWIGLLATQDTLSTEFKDLLLTCQHRLFDLGGELSIPGHLIVKAADVAILERWIDTLNQDLPALENFILPGGSTAVAQAHLVRAVTRRAERLCSKLEDSEINPEAMPYLNRLSDLFFVLARSIALAEGTAEILWDQQR